MKRLLIIFMLLLPAVTHAQKDRTISDLLYFPFACISDPMTTKDQAWQAVTDTFGYCESVNLCPGIHAGSNFDFSNFKWVSVETPVKVKEASPSNIELPDHVGKYKVELGVMRKK